MYFLPSYFILGRFESFFNELNVLAVLALIKGLVSLREKRIIICING